MGKITIGIIACAIALAGCKKDNTYFMSANIDGTSYYADTANTGGHIVCEKWQNTPNYVTIEVSASGVEGFIFTLTNYAGKGIYTLNTGHNEVYYFRGDGSQWRTSSNDGSSSGTLKITSDVKDVLQGTFSMNAVCYSSCDSGAMKYITNGKFRIPIHFQ